MNTTQIADTIKEATGHSPRTLATGGGCEVLAWKSAAGFVCWLSDDDARIPTEEDCGLVLGIYRPDPSEDLWPSNDGCEAERYYHADTATPADLARLLVDAREDAR